VAAVLSFQPLREASDVEDRDRLVVVVPGAKQARPQSSSFSIGIVALREPSPLPTT
jgi:hypothetical protein